MYVSKSFCCPSCSYTFTDQDSVKQNSLYPLLLPCGHSTCRGCINIAFKNHGKIYCSVCSKISELRDGQDVIKLHADIHVLGVIKANAQQMLPKNRIEYLKSPQRKTLDIDMSDVICEHCTLKEAKYRCDKCSMSFCNICFDNFHKSTVRGLKGHVATPIIAPSYCAPVQSGCPDHNSKIIEFYCQDDNELACSLCAISEKHKSHNLVTLAEKNKSCAHELKFVLEDVLAIQRRMKLSQEKLIQAVPNKKINNSQVMKKVRDHFHFLHSTLVLRENELLRQIEKTSSQNTENVENMNQTLSDLMKDLEASLRDAHKVLENPALLISVPELIEKLVSSKTLPCHLVPVSTSEDPKDLCVEFDETLRKAVSKEGRISADMKPMFCLKNNDELPENFILDPLPAEVPVIVDHDSTSDTFSEDSIAIDKKTTSDVVPVKFLSRPSRHEKVYLSHFESPTDFWVMKCCDRQKISNLSDAMNKWCMRNKAAILTTKQVKLSEVYLVKFKEDKKWYRGRVLEKIVTESSPISGNCQKTDEEINDEIIADKPKEEELYKVFYIDYGNTEIVPLDRLRKIQQQFMKMPSLVRHASLYNISPRNGDEWSTEAKEVFLSMVKNKDLNMLLIEERNKICYVDLSQVAIPGIINDVPVSVRDALIFMEQACMFPSEKPKIKTNTRIREFLPPESLRASVKVPVFSCYVESPSLFYVQPASSNRHLSSLIFEMSGSYNNKEPSHNVYLPYVGMMCAARYDNDETWYRAVVKDILEGAKVEVQYVDFGNKQIISYELLAHLQDKFTKLQPQAIACCLADVNFDQGTTWGQKPMEWFKDYFQKIKNGVLLSLGTLPGDKKTKAVMYNLLDTEEINVNALMVKESMAVSTGPFSTVVSKPRKVNNREKGQTNPKQTNFHCNGALEQALSTPTQNQNAECGDSSLPDHVVKVLMSFVESPSSFFVRVAGECQEDLIRLMENIQKEYANSEYEGVKVVEDVTYAVLRVSDGQWYRGKVLTDNVSSSFQVFFMDYGFTETVPISNFRALRVDFSEASFAMKCHLSGVLPAGGSDKWPNVALEKFHELLASKEYMYLNCDVEEDEINRGKNEGEESLAVDLMYVSITPGGALEPTITEYVSVAEKLFETGMALPKRRKRISLSSKDEVVSSEKSMDDGSRQVSNFQPSPSKSLTRLSEAERKIQQLFPPPPTIRKIFKWKPHVVPESNVFVAIATHIDYDGSIFVQEKPKATDKADAINSALMFLYNEEEQEVRKPDVIPEIGEAVAAKFQNDSKWYRADILSVYPHERFKVQFVDYGNCEIISLDDMQLDAPTKDVPRQAFSCILHGIQPVKGKTWPKCVLDFLHERIVEQECIVNIVKETDETDGKHRVMLTRKEGSLDIARELVEMGFAKFTCCDEGEKESSDESEISDLDLDSLNSLLVERIVPLWPKQTVQLPSDEPFEVCITQVLKPDSLCLQRLKIDDPETEDDVIFNKQHDMLIDMTSELNEHANDFEMVTKPIIGMACCAQYSLDKSWYRCEISDIVIEGINIVYVDYGNSETVPLKSLRMLDQEFVNLPAHAYLCTIRGVEVKEELLAGHVAKAMSDILTQPKSPIYAIKVPGEKNEVDLFVKDEEGNFNTAFEEIIDRGLINYNVS